MASLAFFGFDLFPTGIGPYTGSSAYFSKLCKQPGFYTAKGYDTLDTDVEACVQVTGQTGVDSGTGSMGSTNGNAISSTARTTARTAKGGQYAMVRSSFGVGAEVWLTMDVLVSVVAATSYTSAYSPAEDYLQIFKWGDLSVRMKSVTWNGGTSLFDCVIAVMDEAAEVATVSFSTAQANWVFVKIHAKLDATTGLIDVTVNGVAQSAAYTGQNTVTTTSLATASAIFFGVPALDNGTNLHLGRIDNVYFDDAAFPSGRPTARKLALSGETATGWAAVGTSVTTIRDALTSDSLASSTNNAKAGRGTDAGSDVLFDITAPTTSDLDTNVIGFQIGVGGATNRNMLAARSLSVGVSLSGTHNMGAVTLATPLPASVVTTPPGIGVKTLEQIWEKPAAAGPYAKTDLANIKPRLLVA